MSPTILILLTLFSASPARADSAAPIGAWPAERADFVFPSAGKAVKDYDRIVIGPDQARLLNELALPCAGKDVACYSSLMRRYGESESADLRSAMVPIPYPNRDAILSRCSVSDDAEDRSWNPDPTANLVIGLCMKSQLEKAAAYVKARFAEIDSPYAIADLLKPKSEAERSDVTDGMAGAILRDVCGEKADRDTIACLRRNEVRIFRELDGAAAAATRMYGNTLTIAWLKRICDSEIGIRSGTCRDNARWNAPLRQAEPSSERYAFEAQEAAAGAKPAAARAEEASVPPAKKGHRRPAPAPAKAPPPADAPLIKVTDAKDMSFYTDRIAHCPKVVADYNCNLYSGREADPREYAKKKAEMAAICARNVREHATVPGLLSPRNRELYAEMARHPDGPAACELWFKGINGMDHVPDFQTREEIRPSATDNHHRALETTVQGISDALMSEGQKELGSYAMVEESIAFLSSSIQLNQVAQVMSDEVGDPRSIANPDYEEGVLGEAMAGCPLLKADHERRTRAWDAMVDQARAAMRSEDGALVRKNVARTVSELVSAAQLVGEIDRKNKAGEIFPAEAELEHDEVLARFPLLAMETEGKTLLERLQDPKKHDALRSVYVAMAASRNNALHHIREVCGKGSESGLDREGKRILMGRLDPVIEGFLSCSDMKGGKYADACANRQSYGWTLCRAFFAGVDEKNRKDVHKLWRDAFLSAVETGAMILAGPAAIEILGEEALVVRTAEKMRIGLKIYDKVQAAAAMWDEEYGQKAQHDRIERQLAITAFQRGWTSYADFKTKWALVKEKGPLTALEASKVILHALNNLNFLKKLAITPKEEQEIASGLKQLSEAQAAERIRSFVDTGKLTFHLPDGSDHTFVPDEHALAEFFKAAGQPLHEEE